MCKNRRNTESIRQSAEIITAFAFRDLMRLPSVVKIPDKKGNRHSRPNTSIDQLRREPEDKGAQGPEDEKLNKVVYQCSRFGSAD